MGDIARLGIRLLIITLVASVALSFTNMITEKPIQAQIEKESDLSRKAVLSGAESFEKVDLDQLKGSGNWNDSFDRINEVFVGKSGDQVVGYTLKLTPSGYAGPIVLTVGINNDGKLQAIRVGANQETPGLGAKATDPKFQDQYKSKNLDKDLEVVKTSPSQDNQVQAITGATITSKAITSGVNTASYFYNEVLKK